MKVRSVVGGLLALVLATAVVVPAAQADTSPGYVPWMDSPAYGAVRVIDVAVNDNPSSGYVQPTNETIYELIAAVSDYWVANSGGGIGGIQIRHLVRYETALPCNSSNIDVVDEAAQQVGVHAQAWDYYTSEPRAVPEHLLMLGECVGGSGAASAPVTSRDGGGWIRARAHLFTPSSCQLTCGQVKAIAHEFGHNLGFRHAGTTTTGSCTPTPAAHTEITGCGWDQYGDQFSVMGSTTYAPARLDMYRRAWLGSLTSTELVSLSGPLAQTFTLATVGTPGALQGLHVVSGDDTDYYVEYRSATSEPGTWGNSLSHLGYTPRVRIVRPAPEGETTYLRVRPAEGASPQLGIGADSLFISADGTVRVETGALGDTASVTVTIGALPTITATSPAAITGTPAVGSTLTAQAPTTTPASTPATYRWYANGTAISGATAKTYKVPAAYYGSAITVAVTVKAPGHQDLTSTSPARIVTAGGTMNITAPTITGTAKVGSKLSATDGQWVAGTTLKYQWKRGDAAIAGATSKTYTLAAADAGKQVALTVTGTHPNLPAASVTTSSVAVVANPAKLTAATPTITGAAVVGKTLTAKPGDWTSGTTFTYQWLADGTAIKGATKSTFKVATAQAGKKITVKVTGKKSGFTTVTKASKAVGVLTTATPKISGGAVVGKTLTAKRGTWTSGTKFTYQWYGSGKAIKGATKSTFKVAAAQAGKKITVKVTGKKPGFTTVTKASKAVGVLKTATPKISGTARVGRILTVKRGAWTSGTKFTYQWYISGKAIKGATKATYKLKAADRGKTITVKVTGKKSGFTTVGKTSAKTKAIARK